MDNGTIGGTLTPTVQQATMNDSDRRRAEIAAKEERRQKKARERLANRQSQLEQPAAQQSNMESDAGVDYGPYNMGTDQMIAGRKADILAEENPETRKPMSQWGKGDWSRMLAHMGAGFANAEGPSFASGLSSASNFVSKDFVLQDDAADDWAAQQKTRAAKMDDLMLEEKIRDNREADDRAYRSDERQLGWAREDQQDAKRLAAAKTERNEQRDYDRQEKAEDRKYAEKAAAAAATREDAKELRTAAKQNSRDYASDYLSVAKEINKSLADQGKPPLEGDELDNYVIPQLQKAYGVRPVVPAETSMLPQNTTLSTAY